MRDSSFSAILDISSVALITTFFTSVWIWIYFISSIIVKITGRTRAGVKFLQKHLDLKEKPFKSLGMVGQVIVTLIYLIAGIIMYFKTS